MLLAEDLLLLVTDDATGRLSVSGELAAGELVDAGLAGANLVELTLLGKVDISGEQDQGRRGRIIVRDPSPPGDEVLDASGDGCWASSRRAPGRPRIPGARPKCAST
jgi:hypothetical protein